MFETIAVMSVMGHSFRGSVVRVESASYLIGMARLFSALLPRDLCQAAAFGRAWRLFAGRVAFVFHGCSIGVAGCCRNA